LFALLSDAILAADAYKSLLIKPELCVGLGLSNLSRPTRLLSISTPFSHNHNHFQALSLPITHEERF
jgi:hypothetical protein